MEQAPMHTIGDLIGGRMMYFGKHKHHAHRWWINFNTSNGVYMSDVTECPSDFPKSIFDKIDGRYATNYGSAYKYEHGLKGEATVTVLEKFTILAFWSTNGPHEIDNNCAFVMRGEHDYSAMISKALEVFPYVFKELGFPVYEYKED